MYIFSKKEGNSNNYTIISTTQLPPEVSKDSNGNLVLPDNWFVVSKETHDEYTRNSFKYTIEENRLVERESIFFNPPLKEYLSSKRYDIEVGGCSWGEYVIQTDRDSQNKMLAELFAISINIRQSPSDWKFKHKFASLTNEQLTEVIMTARLHIATCFAIEAQLFALIENGTITTKEQIDAAPWPHTPL